MCAKVVSHYKMEMLAKAKYATKRSGTEIGDSLRSLVPNAVITALELVMMRRSTIEQNELDDGPEGLPVDNPVPLLQGMAMTSAAQGAPEGEFPIIRGPREDQGNEAMIPRLGDNDEDVEAAVKEILAPTVVEDLDESRVWMNEEEDALGEHPVSLSMLAQNVSKMSLSFLLT